jgi:ABC-type thiamine transport system substrate-binding protein
MLLVEAGVGAQPPAAALAPRHDLSGVPADPTDAPKIKEFLTYILNRQGQQQVDEKAAMLPLPPAVAAAQVRELHPSSTPQNP